MNLYNAFDLKATNKLKLVTKVFMYLEEKEIKVRLPKIIADEIKKVFSDNKYQYSEEIIFGRLNIIRDKKEIDLEDNKIVNKLFNENKLAYEDTNDFRIYLYCLREQLKLIVTDDWDDFKNCQKIYRKEVKTDTTKQQEISILSQTEFNEYIEKIEEKK